MSAANTFRPRRCQRSVIGLRHVTSILGLLFFGVGAHAQNAKAPARLYGIVTDARTQAPVANAEIISLADGRSVQSDSAGIYSFDKLPPGIMKFMVRASKFPMASFSVAFALGEQFRHDISLLDSAAKRAQGTQTTQALPEVTVSEAKVLPRFVDFERHRRVGGGQYLTRTELDNGNFGNLQDAMRGLRGVLLECGGGNGCSILMARAPARCYPQYIVDGRVDNYFGPTTAIRDIEGIEIYTGPSEIPGELTGDNAACGLVVIWTKSAPPRKKKP